MKTISVINYKGGVGKTTLTANLAADLAFRNFKVLAIDLDPQTNLTFSFIKVEEWKEKYQSSKTIKNWYDAFLEDDLDLDISELIITPKVVNTLLNGKLDIISSHLSLINVDTELATMFRHGSDRLYNISYLKVYSRLRKGLKKLVNKDYDFVLIDCPPNFNIVTRNALVASDAFIIPAKPDYLSTLGIGQLHNRVNELLNEYNSRANNVDTDNKDGWGTIDPKMMGVIFTMVSIWSGAPVSAQQDYITQMQREGFPTFKTTIRENKSVYSSAPESGIPLVLQKAYGETYINVKNELKNMTTEFIDKIDTL